MANKKLLTIGALAASVAGYLALRRYQAQQQVVAALDEAAEDVTAMAASAAVEVSEAADTVAAKTAKVADHVALAASEAAFHAAAAAAASADVDADELPEPVDSTTSNR
ncbi:MAG: hypothetical protein Q8P61_04405 [Candidatus Nanopelagicales bacterium]|nr:hypothetical protein [Candidatus Nanopelagicales bacterium]